MKTRRIRLLVLSVLMICSLAASMVTFSAFAADPEPVVKSYELAINGDFETTDRLGMTETSATNYGATWRWGNVYDQSILGPGLFGLNQRAWESQVTLSSEEGKGPDGSRALKVSQVPGVVNGFSYRLANYNIPADQNPALVESGKTYRVSMDYMMEENRDNDAGSGWGPRLTLQFWMNTGDETTAVWEGKTVDITTVIWSHQANEWKNMSGQFRFENNTAEKKITVWYKDSAAAEEQTASWEYYQFAYIDLIVDSTVTYGTTNDAFYDNLSVRELYDVMVEVNDESAEPILGLEDRFTVNGTAPETAPVYADGFYTFKGLTGENVIAVRDDSIGLDASGTVYGDRSVLDPAQEGASTVNLEANTASRTLIFGTAGEKDLTLSVKNSEGEPITGAVVDVEGYTTMAGTNDGEYVIENVLSSAEPFEVRVRAAGYLPATLQMSGSTVNQEVVLTAVTLSGENLIDNGDMETDENFEPFREGASDAELEGSWRALSDKATLSLTSEKLWSGLYAMDLNLTSSGGDCGVAYRIPADKLENGVYYSVGGKVTILEPTPVEQGNDAAYPGFVPVLKMTDGSVKTWIPAMDFTAYMSFVLGATGLYPLSSWQNISGMVSANYNADTQVFTFIMDGKETVVTGVESVIGYDFYVVCSNAAGSENYDIILDQVSLTEAVGYTGLDLGNDATNFFPNGDFESGAAIRPNYVTPGVWTTTNNDSNVEQSQDYARTAMSSMKATFQDAASFVGTRQNVFAGQMITPQLLEGATLKPGSIYYVNGYVKSASAGVTLNLNFMPTLFENGTYNDGLGVGEHHAVPMTSYTFRESDTLDGDWIRMSATFYYTMDFNEEGRATMKVWFNTTDFSGEPDWEFDNIYEYHALDITFSTQNESGDPAAAEIYFDTWTMYTSYDAEITVKGDDGNPVMDKTLILKDYLNNDVTDQLEVVKDTENNVYRIYGVTIGPLRVTVEGDSSYPEQIVSSARPSRTLEKPYSYTISIKNAAGDLLGEDAVQITVSQEGVATGTVTWNDDGTVTITGLTGTNIIVSVVAEGYQTGNVIITGAGSSDLVLEESVRPPFRATVTIRDSEGNAVSGVTVKVTRNGAEVTGITVTERNGTYTITGLTDNEEGDLVLVMTKDGYTFPTDVVITRNDANKSVQAEGGSTGSEDPQDPSGCGGCGSLSGTGMGGGLVGLLLLAGLGLIRGRKKTEA